MSSIYTRQAPRSFDRRAASLLASTLAYARERSYVGWDLYDGESSRILEALPVDNRWLNIAFQQVVRRAPVNVRPLLLVEQRRNFMGAALFAMANLTAADAVAGDSYGRSSSTVDADRLTSSSTVDADRRRSAASVEDRPPQSLSADGYRREARDLVDWLVANRSVGYSGFCGGHQHPLQGLQTRNEPNTPGVVGTSYAVRALLAAADRLPESDGITGSDDTPPAGRRSVSRRVASVAEARDALPEPGESVSRAADYRTVARTAADFVFEHLAYEPCDSGAHINYKVTDSGDSITLNANALGARMLLDLYDTSGEDPLRERGEAILDYVVSRQTDPGGWTYRDPPSASHLSMDNFHNGFVIESLLRHREVTGSDRYADSLERALSFYRNTLFEADGAPNHDESSSYPRDVHDVAQGVIVFSRAGDRAFARRVLEWGLDTLYAGDGRFYHERRRFFTKRTTLMRWCQAWMAYALAVYLRTGDSRSA